MTYNGEFFVKFVCFVSTRTLFPIDKGIWKNDREILILLENKRNLILQYLL